MRAFVRTHRNRAGPLDQRVVLARGKGLFDQHHAQLRGRSGDGRVGVRREAFIGVQDQARVRPGEVDGLDPVQILRPAQFQFQQTPRRQFRRFSHRGGVCKADRQRRLDRFRRRQSRELPDRPARTFRFQVPERAVQRAARGAGGQGELQRREVEARLHLSAHAFQRRDHAFRRFAVPRIGNALAPPRVGVVGDPHAHGLGLCLGASRDGEGCPQRRGHMGNFEPQIAHGLILPGELCWTDQPCA